MTYTLKTDKQTETKSIKARDLPRHRNYQQAESRFYFQFLKVHKHEIFFVTFFAETESLWSQGPVTQDF
jgi:hypothetical protein